MATHTISAKLEINGRDAQRSLEQTEKASRALDRQMQKTKKTMQDASKAGSKSDDLKRIELIEREAKAQAKLASAITQVGKQREKVGRVQQSLRNGGTGRSTGAMNAVNQYLPSWMTAGGGVAGIGVAAALGVGYAGMSAYRSEDILMRYNKSIGGTDSFNARLLAMGNRLPVSREALLQGGYQALSAGTRNEQEAYNVTRASAEASVLGGPSVNMEEMTKTMTAMQLAFAGKNGPNFSADAMNKLNSMLFTATKMGKVEYKDLGSLLGSSMATASNAGVSQAELLAMGTALTNKGISASEADTAMNRLMLAMLAPTPEARKFAKSKGLDTSQERLQREGVMPMMTDIYNKFSKDPNSIAELQDILGDARSLKAFLSLFNTDSGEGVKRLLTAIQNSKYEDFNNAMEGMAGAAKNQEQLLGNAFTGWAKSVAEASGLTAGYNAAIKGLTDLFLGMTNGPSLMDGIKQAIYGDGAAVEDSRARQAALNQAKGDQLAAYNDYQEMRRAQAGMGKGSFAEKAGLTQFPSAATIADVPQSFKDATVAPSVLTEKGGKEGAEAYGRIMEAGTVGIDAAKNLTGSAKLLNDAAVNLSVAAGRIQAQGPVAPASLRTP